MVFLFVVYLFVKHKHVEAKQMQTQAHGLKLPWPGDINEPTTINFTLAKQQIKHAVIGPRIRHAQLVSVF